MNTDTEISDPPPKAKEVIDLYLFGTARPQIVPARLDQPLRDALGKVGIAVQPGQLVFVGEIAEVDNETDVDTHQPVNVDLTVAEMGLGRDGKRHVHICAAHRIRVTVVFNGQRAERSFSPATNVAAVVAWAKHRFHIDPVAGSKLVLEVEPDHRRPRPNDPLAQVARGACELVCTLVCEVTPQG